MCTIPADLRLPLPKGWPNRIRSAVIHAISLAHFSLTFARSVASNSINARIRLKAENSRLRQEIALLIEEARIKDSRMDRIPAQRRPHYPPIERMAILELRAAPRLVVVSDGSQIPRHAGDHRLVDAAPGRRRTRRPHSGS